MRYVEAKRKEEAEIFAYRIYVSDSIFYQAQNQYVPMRWVDIINQRKQIQDDRSGDEIAFDVIQRLGLKVNKENECI